MDRGGNLVWSADEASLLSAYFDAKQCRDCFQQPHSYDSSPVLYYAAFLSIFVRSLFQDLDPYGGNALLLDLDPYGARRIFFLGYWRLKAYLSSLLPVRGTWKDRS